MTRYSYTAVFEPAEEGGFVVMFPAIPGLATQGETLEEVRAMAADCLRAYLESLALDEDTPPNGRERLVVVSADEYCRLRRRSRQVLTLDELTDADIGAISRAEVDPRHQHVDAASPGAGSGLLPAPGRRPGRAFRA